MTIAISLSPSGQIQATLTGESGLEHTLTLAPNSVESTLLRILRAQALRESGIGSDGSPTQARIDHDARHQLFPKDTCAFCRAERRFGRSHGPQRQVSEIHLGDGCSVRRYTPRGKPKTPTLEELEL